ncbi:hypothetical protein Misp02_22740 [Microtetraspora sp. NBRC 16547]|nr:hypothetical protein Misp02_22740 [Microtetraspora sp. NBRC 16547]
MVASAVMALLCTAVAVLVLVVAQQAAAEHRTKQLVAHAMNVVKQIRHSGAAPHLAPGRYNASMQVFNPVGTMVGTTPDMAGKPSMTNLQPDVDGYATERRCGGPVFPDQCKIAVEYPFHRANSVWRLNMAVADVPWYVGPRLLVPLAAGWLLLVGATAVGTRRIVGKTLAPVSAISGKLAQITASDLGHRVPVPKYRDELRDLAETANRTLDRAQSAVEQHLRFASDASHDLRSPLTAMRAQVEEGLMYPEETNWPQTAGLSWTALNTCRTWSPTCCRSPGWTPGSAAASPPST